MFAAPDDTVSLFPDGLKKQKDKAGGWVTLHRQSFIAALNCTVPYELELELESGLSGLAASPKGGTLSD